MLNLSTKEGVTAWTERKVEKRRFLLCPEELLSRVKGLWSEDL